MSRKQDFFNIVDKNSEEENSENEMEEEELEECDADLVNESQLKNNFSCTYSIISEVAISLNKVYILHLSRCKDKVAAGLSNKSFQIFDLNHLKKLQDFKAHDSKITDIRFNSNDCNIFYTSSLDGTIKIWDLRTQTCSYELKDDTLVNLQLKPITSFDISSNGKFLCAGTELIADDAYLLFWDLRNPKLLGGYWESHTDLVTQVEFNPNAPNTLASGSTDGLINIYDISQSSEDDALQLSLNTESSVNKLNWLNHQGKEAISCLTDTEDLQLWRVDDSAPYLNFDRETITYYLQRKSVKHCYSLNVHNKNKEGEECFLLAGSSAGKGEILRTLNITSRKLKPSAILEGNKQLLRSSLYDFQDDLFITGGESGILSVWKTRNSLLESSNKSSKMGSILQEKKSKNAPY